MYPLLNCAPSQSCRRVVWGAFACPGGISRLLELLEDTIAQLQDAKRISAKAASAEDARIQGVVAGLDQDIVNMDSDLTQKQARLVAAQSAFEAAVADEGTREQNKVALTTQGKTLTRGCAASAAAHQTKVNQYQRVSSEADQMRALLVCASVAWVCVALIRLFVFASLVVSCCASTNK